MSRKRDDLAAAWGAAAELGRRQGQADPEKRAARMVRVADAMPLAEIRPRAGGDTRSPDLGHVVALAESIAALGLLEPVVVDRVGRLVAGANRLAALRLLAIEDSEARATAVVTDGGAEALAERARDVEAPEWVREAIPVRRLAFDAEESPDDALAAEVAENEHRRDYTKAEVLALAERLRAAGFVERAGRPRRGERALKPALATIIGKSMPTIERLLKTPSGEGVSSPAGPDYPTAARAALRAMRKALAARRGRPTDEAGRELRERMKGLADDLEEWLG